MTNYREISLMSIVAKPYKISLNRIRGKLDAKLRVNQVGHCPRWRCAEHICFLRRILKGSDSKNLSLVAVLVDFKKALHSIDRNVLLNSAESQKRELMMHITLFCLKMKKIKHKSNLIQFLVRLKKWG